MKKWFKHNYFLVVSVGICFLIGLYAYGCESLTRSVLHSGLRVSRAELQIEAQELLDNYERDVRKVELGLADLDRQDEIKEKLVGFGMTVAEGGTVNPLGIATLLGSVLAGGLVLDNRRKDTVIKTLKNNK